MISIRRAVSALEFRHIFHDDEIFSRIAEDGINKESLVIPFDDNHCYLLVMKDLQVVGVWYLHPLNRTTLEIHAHVLKGHRDIAMESGRLVFKWFAESSPKQYLKVNAEIPDIFPDVYRFAKKLGLKDEGINRLSTLRGGVLVDQYRLGITRKEAALLHGGDQ